MWQQRIPVNQAQNPLTEFRQCFKCNYECLAGPGPCPQCRNRKFLTASEIRTRGILPALVGLFLVIFMGAIAAIVGVLLFGSMNDPASAKKFEREFFAFMAVFVIFATVIAFGVNSIVGGLWMIAFGKRNRFFVWIMWATLLLVFAAGTIFRILT